MKLSSVLLDPDSTYDPFSSTVAVYATSESEISLIEATVSVQDGFASNTAGGA